MVKKILVSQPKPTSAKSPYYDIAADFGIELVFRPFIKVERVAPQDLLRERVNMRDYTAVVFTSRHAIDHFFSLAKELRVTMPDTTKYFCVTETVALYIQKYTAYRKRKVFFGTTGKIDDLLPTMVKHKTEKYLVPISDVAGDTIKQLLDARGLHHRECVMYRTVNNNFTSKEIADFDYDLALFFSPAGIKSLQENFPDMTAADIKIGTFGPSTAKAVREAGFELSIEAPTPAYPSMTSALRHFLQEQE